MTRPRRNVKGNGPRMKHSLSRPSLVKLRISMKKTITRDQSPNVKAIAIFVEIVNMIEEGSDEEVGIFLNDIDALATNVLELNLCQYSNTFDWFINNGTSKHVTRNNKLFTNIKDGKSILNIKAIGGTIHLIAGKGNFVIPVGKNVKIKEEVLYVLDVNSNLLYVGVLTDKGF